MQRAPESISVFVLALLAAVGLVGTGCWGEPFQARQGIGADDASLTSTSTSTSVGTVTGTGGVAGTADTTAGLGTTTLGATTTGAAGEGPVTASEFGENCRQLRLPANRDTYIWGMFPDDNHDHVAFGDDRLEVSQYGSASKRTLLRFEIYLDTPAEWTVYKAFLELQVLLADSYGGQLNLHRMTQDWEERVVNWNVSTTNQLWTTPGGDFEPEPFSALAVTPAMQGTVAVWDVTTEVQRIHAGGENYGWMLKEAGEPAQGAGLNYAFPGRDTENEDELVPILAVHFCN